jgi:hypothetical protein
MFCKFYIYVMSVDRISLCESSKLSHIMYSLSPVQVIQLCNIQRITSMPNKLIFLCSLNKIMNHLWYSLHLNGFRPSLRSKNSRASKKLSCKLFKCPKNYSRDSQTFMSGNNDNPKDK